MNKTILLLIPLLFLACQDEESAQSVEEPVQVSVATEETIAMVEHERLLGEAESVTEALAQELTHQVQSFETAFKAKEDQIETLEVKVLELTASLEAYKKQARDSRVSLNELRKLPGQIHTIKKRGVFIHDFHFFNFALVYMTITGHGAESHFK